LNKISHSKGTAGDDLRRGVDGRHKRTAKHRTKGNRTKRVKKKKTNLKTRECNQTNQLVLENKVAVEKKRAN
jgi:hypothetical protein